MNKQRRKEIDSVINQLTLQRDQLELQTLIDEIDTSYIESLRDEEQDCFDNLPEGLQQSERGEQMEEAVSFMDDAISAIEDINNLLEEIADADGNELSAKEIADKFIEAIEFIDIAIEQLDNAKGN